MLIFMGIRFFCEVSIHFFFKKQLRFCPALKVAYFCSNFSSKSCLRVAYGTQFFRYCRYLKKCFKRKCVTKCKFQTIFGLKEKKIWKQAASAFCFDKLHPFSRKNSTL